MKGKEIQSISLNEKSLLGDRASLQALAQYSTIQCSLF